MTFCVFFSLGAYQMKLNQDLEETPELTIVRVEPTPEPNTASMTIAYPEPSDIVQNPTIINFRLRGYSLGTRSYFPRSEEILDPGEGQSIHIIVDDEPYFLYTGAAIDPFDQDGDFYQQNYQLKLPFSLKPGKHTIRMFPARSYGESLKSPECFDMVTFYVGRKTKEEKISFPILTYNEPNSEVTYRQNQPILLDFLVTGGILAKGSYGVKASIDGKTIRTLRNEGPFYIYGLDKGRHKIQLSLVNQNDQEIAGKFRSKTALIKVE